MHDHAYRLQSLNYPTDDTTLSYCLYPTTIPVDRSLWELLPQWKK